MITSKRDFFYRIYSFWCIQFYTKGIWSRLFRLCSKHTYFTNTSQRFTPKSITLDLLKISSFYNLGGSVTLYTQLYILSRHSRTIIFDLYQFFSSSDYFYMKLSSSCIKCIFYQLFYDRSRTLDYLSCFELIDKMLWEFLDHRSMYESRNIGRHILTRRYASQHSKQVKYPCSVVQLTYSVINSYNIFTRHFDWSVAK